MQVRFERVAFAYPDAIPVLTEVDLHVAAGFAGVVGENGAGKSTLLALAAGALRPTEGRVIVEPRGARVEVCAQEVDVCPAAARALAERDDADAGRWRSLLALDAGGLARWPTLSPGERRRWQIGGALAADPDVLLLDEPTNHVDAAGRALLVGALRRFRGAALVCSHDRALLDELTRATIRVAHGTARLVPGAYSDAKAQWEADEQRQRAVRTTAQRTAKRAAQQLAAARHDQQGAEASRRTSRRKKGPQDHDATTITATTLAAWAEARAGRRVEVARREAERAADAVPDAPTPRAVGRSVFVGYERAPRRWLAELDARELRAGDAAILRDVRVAVGAADRIRLAGANGAGKTTLLDTLLARADLPPERVLHLPQELPPGAGARLLAEIRALPPAPRGRTLSLVAALGVDPDRVLASPAPSPGETRKLALALGLGRHAWLLALDEPTNHLDLPSIERLEAALAAYPGALVLASHDDAFASALTHTTWCVAGARVTT